MLTDPSSGVCFQPPAGLGASRTCRSRAGQSQANPSGPAHTTHGCSRGGSWKQCSWGRTSAPSAEPVWAEEVGRWLGVCPPAAHPLFPSRQLSSLIQPLVFHRRCCPTRPAIPPCFASAWMLRIWGPASTWLPMEGVDLGPPTPVVPGTGIGVALGVQGSRFSASALWHGWGVQRCGRGACNVAGVLQGEEGLQFNRESCTAGFGVNSVELAMHCGLVPQFKESLALQGGVSQCQGVLAVQRGLCLAKRGSHTAGRGAGGP